MQKIHYEYSICYLHLDDGNLLNKHPEFMKRLFFNPTIHGEKGELELKDLVKSDRAEFTINVTNIYGQTDFTTLVRVKGKECDYYYYNRMKVYLTSY